MGKVTSLHKVQVTGEALCTANCARCHAVNAEGGAGPWLAGNDGITAVINPLDRVLQRFPRGERAAFSAQADLSRVMTLCVHWGTGSCGVSVAALLVLSFLHLRSPERGGACA